MNLIEKNGNLFDAPQEYYLAHCISGDFALGAGIAKTFDQMYNMRFKLHRDYPLGDKVKYDYVGKALLVYRVFNLVTKLRYFHKPSYSSLGETLTDMRKQCEQLNIKKIAIPKIGTGLDRLKWDFVKYEIKNSLDDSDIEIVVYILQSLKE